MWIFLFFLFCSSVWAGPEVTKNPNFDPANAGIIQGITTGVFGDSTNNMTITDGVATLNGTAKRFITRRPKIDIVHQISHAVPDEVQHGMFFGYSMPVHSDDEELYFKSFVPYRYDGASDITFHIFCYSAGTEDVGDYFKFQLSWEHCMHEGLVLPSTNNDVSTEQIIISGRTAQYSMYELVFTLDYDISDPSLTGGCILGSRLRRLDATNPDVDNEIVVVDWKLKYQIDKLYGSW